MLSLRKSFRMLTAITAGGCLLLATSGISPLSLQAAFPGANGKIAFQSFRDGNAEIYVMNADGSGQTNLTNHPGNDYNPDGSPDGARIAFYSDRAGNQEIYAMNADGSSQTNLTNHPAVDVKPAWSPDGTKLAFTSYRDGNAEIYVMNTDGSNQTRLTINPTIDNIAAWSPDGTKIAFQTDRDGNDEIYIMNANGSGQLNLTNHPGKDNYPSWSPDGSKIVFYTERDGNFEVYVMNADGSGQSNLSNNSAPLDITPDWSPDGSQIVFQTNRDGNDEIYVMNADGSAQTNLTTHPSVDGWPDWQSGRSVVTIDIKPGSNPNSINPRSNGKIPVAILTTSAFAASTVDPTTIRFGKTGAEAAAVQSALEDVDQDGDTDLILHFNTQDTGIQCGDTAAFLKGMTLGGQQIQGSDAIVTVGCK